MLRVLQNNGNERRRIRTRSLKPADNLTDAGLLARSQFPEGPATGHLDTGFSWFPYVYKRMLRWFPSFQVATTCLTCSPPDLNFFDPYCFTLCVFVVPYVYLLCLMCICCIILCIAVLTLDARLLARSQYPEGPATGHLDTDFPCFPCVYKRMLRWFPSFQVATTCLSCSPPDLNFLVTFFFHICVLVK